MLEIEVHSHLSTTTSITVTSSVSTRIYPIWLPTLTQYPAITYIRISGLPENDLQGYSNLENIHLQIDAWAKTFKQAKALSTCIHTAMGTATAFKALLTADNDIYEDDAEVYRVIQEYSIWDRN